MIYADDRGKRRLNSTCESIGDSAVLTTAWPFIELDDRGVPLIGGTRVKVSEVVAEHQAYRWDADQIHRQHPHLSLPQIHAALGYYYEHREECDREMDAALQQADDICQIAENPALLAKLRSRAGG